jgi:hypothetical protein
MQAFSEKTYQLFFLSITLLLLPSLKMRLLLPHFTALLPETTPL